MLRRGAVFAGFVIERELGRGGMGAVYAARDRRLPRLTALKLMHRDLFSNFETRARFEREADLIAQLDHPNIITVYDRGVDDERLWISMQFVDGTDASAVPVQQFGNERIAQIVTQTASALDYAHRQGVLHRDVKPANILLSRTAGFGAGFDERVVLTDFGIAKFLDDTAGLTRTGQFTATIAYASPEQLTSSPLDGRSDQYSLACTIFRLLIGTGPYDAPNPATVMLGHLNAAPPMASTRRTTLPVAVDAVLAKAMAKDPHHRFHTCADFAAALTDALRHQPRTSSQPAVSAPTANSRHSAPTVTPRRHDPTALRHPAAEPEGHASSGTRSEAAAESRDQWRSAVRDDEPGKAARTATATSTWTERVRACLLGGAIGDALGAPVEASTLQQIREEYGHLGIGDDADQLRISEETQLTAFTVEALIRGSVRARATGTGGATLGLLQQGLLVWLRGQVREIPDQPITLHSSLVDHPELIEQRGMAVSVHAALRAAAERRDPTNPLGTRDRPINHSKGAGAVMRAAPCGFGYAADRGGSALTTIFELGCDAATLTHGHPSGWLPAGVLAALVYQAVREVDTMTALDRTRAELARYPHHEETSAALEAAIALAARTCRPGRKPSPEDLETLGDGWIAPEALAIAVYTVLAAESVGGPDHLIVRNGLLLSVNHSGNSDATGSIAGGLLGARYGRTALPHRWSHTVDAGPVLDRLATDYCAEFGLTPPRDETGQPAKAWFDRYPA